jgi:hypothetical protein
VTLSRSSESTMRYLHISIDGSWLRKLCAPSSATTHGVFASKTVNPDRGVKLDFNRLNQLLLTHIHQFDKHVKLGKLVLATSVFLLPDDIESWPQQHPFALRQIQRVKDDVLSRQRFVESAIKAGYTEDCIYYPEMKPWILDQCITKTYSEKQVDIACASSFVGTAVCCPSDYHCILAGDGDFLPALRFVYPTHTRNVFLATTDVEEDRLKNTSAYALNSLKLDIPTLYLQDHVADMIQGDLVYTCVHCDKIFDRFNNNPVPKNTQPCCSLCYQDRQNNRRKAA